MKRVRSGNTQSVPRPREMGMTLVEMAIALVIMGFILVIAFTTYGIISRSVQEGSDIADLQETTTRVLQLICTDIMYSRGFLEAEMDRLTVVAADHRELTYETEGGRITRSGREVPLMGNSVRQLSFGYTGKDWALDSNQDGVVDEAEMDVNGDGYLQGRELLGVSAAEVSLTLENPTGQFTLISAARVRNPTWEIEALVLGSERQLGGRDLQPGSGRLPESGLR